MKEIQIPLAKRNLEKTMFIVLVFAVVLIIVFPFLWMLLLSFKTNNEIVNAPLALPESWSFNNYRRALDSLNLLRMYKNTLTIVLITESITLIFTFMSSFAMSRMVFNSKRLRGNLYLFFLLGLAIPVYTLIFPLYRINITFGLLGNNLAVILPYIATAISFNTLVFVGFLNSFPGEIEEASVIDGCNIFQLCTRIVVPISKAVFATITVFNVLYIWNEYPFAITFLTKREQYTISLSASLFKGLYSIDYSGIVAATVMIIIPQLIFYASLQKYIIEGMTEGAIKG